MNKSLKIVFLDGHTVNPGDLSWEGLTDLGELHVYDRTLPDEVFERAQGANVLIVNKTALGSVHFERFSPDLRLVCVAAAGFDRIDVTAARRYGVCVCNAAGYGTASVAQMFFALLIEMTNRVGHYARANRGGFWSKSPDFCCWDSPLVELQEKRLCIIGYGRIGETIARIAQAMGMRISAVTHRTDLPAYVTRVSVNEAFAESDVISLNAPLTADNYHFVNAKLLSKAKPGLLLVNTARGGLVDELAVVDALRNGRLGGYAADVMEQEPPRADHPFWSEPGILITPHIAWITSEARTRLMQIIENNIRAFLAGKPQNVVNG